MEQILEQNKELIDTFVSLARCHGTVLSPKYEWFYRAIPRERIQPILHLVSDDDIRHDIIVFILEQHQKYKGTNFNSYLRMSLGLFVRDRLTVLINQFSSSSGQQESYGTMDLYGSFDLRWVLSDKFLPLTDYERYLLYLDLHKCYTVNEICETVYQDRSTVRHVLAEARQVLKEEYS